MYFRNFDPNISQNPFSYFTQITYFAFIRRIGKEKKQAYIKYKMTEQAGIIDFMGQQVNLNGSSYEYDSSSSGADDVYQNREPLYENMAEYIHDFEEKVEEKKKKRQKAKLSVDPKPLPDKKKRKV